MTATTRSNLGRPKFGVVVLTMGNRPDDLNHGLASLLRQREVDLDVVVVGNGWQPANSKAPRRMATAPSQTFIAGLLRLGSPTRTRGVQRRGASRP